MKQTEQQQTITQSEFEQFKQGWIKGIADCKNYGELIALVEDGSYTDNSLYNHTPVLEYLDETDPDIEEDGYGNKILYYYRSEKYQVKQALELGYVLLPFEERNKYIILDISSFEHLNSKYLGNTNKALYGAIIINDNIYYRPKVLKVKKGQMLYNDLDQYVLIGDK